MNGSLTLYIEDDTTAIEDEGLYELSVFELIIWCLLYATIAVMAVFGNLLVIYVTLARLRTRSITTYFIINLAFADLMTGIFAIPFKFQAALFQVWHLPPVLCKIVPYTETVTLSVSVFTLTASAVHEFRTVFFPRQGRLSANNARLLVSLIWIIALIVSLPHGLFHEVMTFTEETISIDQCRPVYAETQWWKVYNVYLTVITYFIPMVILDSAYTMIAIKIWTATSSLTQELQVVGQQNAAVEIGNRRLMKMLIIVVALFSFCWFPLETYSLLCEIKPDINAWYYINVFFFGCHWLAMSNSCLNPIIYGLYNDKYNREYKRVFRQLITWNWNRKADLNSQTQKFETEFAPSAFVQRELQSESDPHGNTYTESFQIKTNGSHNTPLLGKRSSIRRIKNGYLEVATCS